MCRRVVFLMLSGHLWPPLNTLYHFAVVENGRMKKRNQRRRSTKKDDRLPVKMSADMKMDVDWIGINMDDISMAQVARKFIAEGIERYKKKYGERPPDYVMREYRK